MPRPPLDVELHFIGHEINLVVPRQDGVSFEDAAPRLAALAEQLGAQFGLPVRINSEPERHLHGPEDAHVRAHATGQHHPHA